MSVRLQFPRGGFFSFPRQFVVGGAALNLSGGTLVAYLKTSPDDADSAALATLTIAAVDATQGTVLISLTAAQTASLPLGIAAYWVARATVAGATYAPEALHGPVVLTPLEYLAGAELDDTGVTETLVPDETGLTLVPQWQPVNANLTALAGLTSAADTVPYFTGAGTAALATLTSYARTLLATATAAAARTALGLAAIAASGSATDLTSGTVPTDRLYTSAVGYNITGGANLDALAGLTSAADKLPYFTGAGTAALTSFSATGRTLVNASALTAAGLGLTNGAAIDALGAVATNGLLARTAANTYAARTLTGPAAGLTVTNGDGAAGNPTLALANDLAAVEGLAANGLAVRTATDTWTVRTITGTAGQVTVTNGDGVAGAPTLSLPTALTGINSITSTALANLVLATGTFGTSITFASATGIPTFATHVVLEGVTSTGATGTGNFVFSAAPVFTGTVAGASLQLSSLTSGRITTAGASGLLQDSASLLWNGSLVQIGTTSATRLLLGTATDSSNGALQLANHTTLAGGVGFGSDTNVYRMAAGNLGTSASSALFTIWDSQSVALGAGGQLNLDHRAADGSQVTYAAIKASAVSGTPGSHSGSLLFRVASAGVVTTRGTMNPSGDLILTSTTASTSTTTGSGIFSGGIGVAGATWIGGLINIASTLVVQGATSAIGIALSASCNLALAAGTTAISSLRIPHGAAPTSPVNGDIWTTTSGLFVRINGSTVGPLT